MRQNLIAVFLFLLPATALMAQQEKRDIHKGNELYKQKKYTEAEASYRKSVAKNGQSVAGNLNLGDALYKQKKYADAAEQFGKIAGTATDKQVRAQAYHNLGNALLESKKIQESIDAYQKALMENPKDDETRYNLAYAQQLLKKQQQQDKDKKKQDKDKKNNQDKDKKDNQDKNDKNKDQQNGDKDKQDGKDNQDKDKNGDNQDKQQQNGKQQQQPGSLSREDAERMLDALNNDEKQTQDKLKNKKLKGAKVQITKDW
ncbi:tetratricopeptide repeat protein [Pedobacter sp. BS3]|nr:tetratricopeptide repeat protein [Pedobacter sp. BS3]